MISDMTILELLDQLNDIDEHNELEAKSQKLDTVRSLLETVCSLSNEPGLGGGTILLGVAESDASDGPRYVLDNVDDPDKAQLDLATQCKCVFNHPVFPEIKVEKAEGKTVLRIAVDELPSTQKPLYFKADGLPRGAYRRVGSSDLRCTNEDIGELFADPSESYDQTPIKGATLDDVDEAAVRRYCDLRRQVNPVAEELSYDTQELLEALNCVNPDDKHQLNLSGVLLFGSSKLQRRVIPMARVDYIRVPGTEWVADPDESFNSIDMRGPLLTLVFRVVDAVANDLPRGFLLKGDSIQADSVGLPLKVLREAVVNALMHCSYKVGRPTQVIRYDNRIEIRNAGYSLKPEDRLGTPGSVPRNKTIAPVFHDTNLAETKGSGIKRMKKLMREVHLAQPTFESDREGNEFTIRLLLHHFLGPDDLAWLGRFAEFGLSDNQKTALVFMREAGAINNPTYRQICGCDTLKASIELRKLRDCGVIRQKGRGTATYYIPSWRAEAGARTNQSMDDSGPSMDDSGPSMDDSVPSMDDSNPKALDGDAKICAIAQGAGKHKNRAELETIIWKMCSVRALERGEIATFLRRTDRHVRCILKSMVQKKILAYKYPEMIKHPHQAYTAVKTTMDSEV